MALAQFAVRRGGSLGDLELAVYSEDLMQFDLDDCLAVLERIGKTPRVTQFEPILPPPNEIVAHVNQRVSNRSTRIREEQLRPAVREAIARAKEYGRLQASGVEEPAPFSIGELIASKPKALSMESGRRYIAETVQIADDCPHCGFKSSPQDSETLYKLSDYYRKRAENAKEKESEDDDTSCASKEIVK